MILVTTETISGKELEMLGLCRGSTIQSKNIGRDITQSFKPLVGGELKAYTCLLYTSSQPEKFAALEKEASGRPVDPATLPL